MVELIVSNRNLEDKRFQELIMYQIQMLGRKVYPNYDYLKLRLSITVEKDEIVKKT